ncbi:MAG: hypothetical protein WBJ21_15405 [Burkholderiaceae bacterium]
MVDHSFSISAMLNGARAVRLVPVVVCVFVDVVVRVVRVVRVDEVVVVSTGVLIVVPAAVHQSQWSAVGSTLVMRAVLCSCVCIELLDGSLA